MRRITSVLALLSLSVPLLATVPASKVKEPNAVFVYGYGTDEGRIQATLFDRTKKMAIDYLDTTTDLPLYGGGGIEGNDRMQFSPATKKIYIAIKNISEWGGEHRINKDLTYDNAIIETDFAFRNPTPVFTCDDCDLNQWIVHPTDAKLYVSLPQAAETNPDEFRRAKLVEVTLGEKRKTRVIARIPNSSRLSISPDGKKVMTFGRAYSDTWFNPYGALVTVQTSNKKRTQTILNFPSTNVFGLPVSPQGSDVSPDGLEMVYHMSIVDARTKETDVLIDETTYGLDNYFIGWSRDSNKLLFQLREPNSDPNAERIEVPIVYDRKQGTEWILPIQDSHYLDWAPAQTAILFQKRGGDIGFYDLEAREWVFVASGEDASWVTLPTKKVPKR